LNLCHFASLFLSNLYFKSITDFTLLKLNDTELLIFDDELFFFKGSKFQRNKETKVFVLKNLTTFKENLCPFAPLPL